MSNDESVVDRPPDQAAQPLSAQASTDVMRSKYFRVLSLDGGGMRGTYTATYLSRVASAFAKRRGLDRLDVGRDFDLIVGTNTGGLLASALVAGLPLENVVALYREHGPRIFQRRMPGSPHARVLKR